MTTRYLPSLDIGTPPREWSESVIASSPASDAPATFPDIEGSAGDAQTTEKKSREEFLVPEELGKQQAQKPTAAGDHPSIHATVAQTAKQSKGRQERLHVSLPSTELKGAQPSEYSGGVGALPGNLSESSVALLPDERQERAQERQSASPRQRRGTIKPSTVGGGDEPGASEKEEATIPAPTDSVTSQPSEAPEAKAAEVIEDSVAASAGPQVEEASKTRGPRELGEKGPGTGTEESNLGPEKPDQVKRATQDVQEEGSKEGQLAPAKVKESYTGASTAEYQSSLGTQQAELDSPATKTGKRASIGAEKKPGFITMVKGEMKILAGKVSGDEHKVEEGRKIVHGEM